jgi:chemotaxis protein methyltransferase CheR
VNDTECVRFLQWALPRLGLRWRGFRRVRGQVCKRIGRRMHALGMTESAAYVTRLGADAAEWRVLDGLCTVSISRFYRDRAVFDGLGDNVLPALAAQATTRPDSMIRCWSAGCASGEEPYTLTLIWNQCVRARFPRAALAVLATDIDAHLLERARVACYSRSSLRELPQPWIDAAFVRQDDKYCVRDRWRSSIEFRQQDIRTDLPSRPAPSDLMSRARVEGPFDLVLCRNVAFTYFDAPAQRRIVSRLAEEMSADGFLVVGRHESVSDAPFEAYAPGLGIYRRVT